jgi:hypothetical protein
MDPRNAEFILGRVRDDLSSTAGMNKFIVSLVGSFTVGE